MYVLILRNNYAIEFVLDVNYFIDEMFFLDCLMLFISCYIRLKQNKNVYPYVILILYYVSVTFQQFRMKMIYKRLL